RSSFPSIVVCRGEATRPQYSYDEFVYMIFGQNCSFIRCVNRPSRRPVSGSSCSASLKGKTLTGYRKFAQGSPSRDGCANRMLKLPRAAAARSEEHTSELQSRF